MTLCARHEDALVMALELRGLLRPTLIAEADLAPLTHARHLIETHCTHLAGKAAVQMFADQACPLCFCQRALRVRHVDVNLEEWIAQAAEEAFDDVTSLADVSAPSLIVHH